MGKKPSILRYYWLELKWAGSTSLNWIRLFFRDRRQAMSVLREGLKSEEFRARSREWTQVTSFAYGRLGVIAPLMVGGVTAVYSGLMQNSLVVAGAWGLAAAILTYFAFRVLPFALLASVPILAFFFIRALLPANVPEPPAEEVVEVREPGQGNYAQDKTLGQSGSEEAVEIRGPGQDSYAQDKILDRPGVDLLAEENQLTPNGVMLAQFEAGDLSLAERILLSDGSVVLTDPDDIAKVSKWVDYVRKGHETVTARREQLESLSLLSNYVDLQILFELGLLDRDSFRDVSEYERGAGQGSGQTLEELFASQRYAGSEGTGLLRDDYVDPTEVNPQPRPGQTRLISPRGSGYLIWSLDDLTRMPSPSLMSDVCHEIVTTYVKNTGDSDMMKQWMVLEQTAPNPRPLQSGINLRGIEDQILALEVRDTAAQALARRYARIKQIEREYEDYIALQQPIARLVQKTLVAAHASMVTAHKAEMADVQAREASYKDDKEHPFRYMDVPETPSKTKEQRREELRKMIQDAVPKERLDR